MEEVEEEHQVDIVVRTYNQLRAQKEVEFSSVYYVAGEKILVHQGVEAQKLSDLERQTGVPTKKSTSLAKIARSPPSRAGLGGQRWTAW